MAPLTRAEGITVGVSTRDPQAAGETLPSGVCDLSLSGKGALWGTRRLRGWAPLGKHLTPAAMPESGAGVMKAAVRALHAR